MAKASVRALLILLLLSTFRYRFVQAQETLLAAAPASSGPPGFNRFSISAAPYWNAIPPTEQQAIQPKREPLTFDSRALQAGGFSMTQLPLMSTKGSSIAPFEAVRSGPELPAAFTVPVATKPARQRRDGAAKARVRPFRSVALGGTASTLGPGIELATAVSPRLNLRVDASYLNWATSFSSSGFTLAPNLKFSSGRATMDWFPTRNAFHLSFGVLLLQANMAGAVEVASGNSFTLSSTTYTSSVDDPVNGFAQLVYKRHPAPVAMIGLGNVLPRSGQHFSMPIEIGAAYLRPPQLTMRLSGTACVTEGCFDAATNADIQAGLKSELSDIQSDLRLLEVYPIVSIGFACRF